MKSRSVLQSDLAACLWIPSYALRCEEARRRELRDAPAAVLAPEDSRRVWQLSREARREGVKAGMTVSQAIGLCPTLTLIEPDPVHYDEQFAHLLLRLADVSPVIEPAELGRVYIGVDGLDGLIGGAEEQLARIGRTAERQERSPLLSCRPAVLPSCRTASGGARESSPPG